MFLGGEFAVGHYLMIYFEKKWIQTKVISFDVSLMNYGLETIPTIESQLNVEILHVDLNGFDIMWNDSSMIKVQGLSLVSADSTDSLTFTKADVGIYVRLYLHIDRLFVYGCIISYTGATDGSGSYALSLEDGSSCSINLKTLYAHITNCYCRFARGYRGLAPHDTGA